ncbi:uncharacterized protein EDB93DRAFT_1319457 [Suillus bovinus]|uniref:uncharacterized protein n=1 Tax=Suillus bovinus TaxID=48563 RepID=UPI001B86B81C|nr:uncharacterized protein EDB93DRAFT_1319457 [Suillus bovinus]KAG2156871.1 hypothetical protein EDB93DRAFT_1319457 [Suillus bovinus]
MATVAHHIHSDYDPADRERLEKETGQRQLSLLSTRRAPPPSFVPAHIQYDEWGSTVSLTHTVSSNTSAPDNGTFEWYRDLTRDSSRTSGNQPPTPRSSSTPNEAPKPKKAATTKNDYKPSSPAPSLADLLARDPPPLLLLRKGGWNEGEGLGAHVARSLRPAHTSVSISHAGTKESRDILPDLIDLTQSGSEPEDDDFESFHRSLSLLLTPTSCASKEPDPYSQRLLLTPIPTVLKSDRLGIGLKAKTEGPYKQSKKRFTHNQAALASHIKTSEELRRKRVKVGRGRRGFAKVRKREENESSHILTLIHAGGMPVGGPLPLTDIDVVKAATAARRNEKRISLAM